MNIDRLNELLTYDPYTGELRWKVDRAQKKAGDIAGTKRPDGRRSVQIDGKLLLGYRIAWAMHYNEQPPKYIDHINTNPGDDRIINLRAATQSENMRNRRVKSGTSSGTKGVSYDKERGKWKAQIKLPNGAYKQERYDTKEQAERAYRRAVEEHHGDFAYAE